MCFACCSRDDTFQILKMIIRGHVVLVSAHFVGKAVIGDIYHNKKVGTTNRFFDVTFALTGTKTDDLGINQKRWKAVTLWNLALSALVFGLFQGMVFGRLVQRHTARIRGYGTERKWFWQFFDGKSFLIMVFMMAFGIGLRASGLAPEGFIAVFYTGLGASLLTAGLRFLLAVSRG